MSSSSIKEPFDGTISGKFLSQEGSYEWGRWRSTVNSMRNIVRFGFIFDSKTNVLWFSVGTKYQTVSTSSSCRLSLRFRIMMFIIRIRGTVLCMLHGLRVNVHTVDHHDIVVSLRRVSSRLKRKPWIQVTRAIPWELQETMRAYQFYFAGKLVDADVTSVVEVVPQKNEFTLFVMNSIT